jgi:hypothetical protein
MCAQPFDNRTGPFQAFFQASVAMGRPEKNLIYWRGQTEETCAKIPGVTRSEQSAGMILYRGGEGFVSLEVLKGQSEKSLKVLAVGLRRKHFFDLSRKRKL